MANILITGGTGFIGVPLVKKLNSLGHNLKLLIRESSDITPFEDLNNIEYITGDIRDIDSLSQAVNNIDIIYHLAAYTQIWAKDKSIYEEINIKGSENIAKVALEKKNLLIFISSFFAIGPYNFGEEVPNFETHERNVDFFMDYEKSKCESAKIIQDYKEKGLFVIVKTSNPSSHNFQDLFSAKIENIPNSQTEIEIESIKLERNYIKMARLIYNWGLNLERKRSDFHNLGVVVGATYPNELKRIREIVENSFILIPGYGAQGAQAIDIKYGFKKNGLGGIVNSSRGVMFAYNKDRKCAPERFSKAARDEIVYMNKTINKEIGF